MRVFYYTQLDTTHHTHTHNIHMYIFAITVRVLHIPLIIHTTQCTYLNNHSESPDPTTRPRQLVTAAVDAIHVRGSIPMDRDLHMAGQVVWTGRASLDIRMTLQEVCGGCQG